MALAGGLEHQAAVRFHLLMILGEHADDDGADALGVAQCRVAPYILKMRQGLPPTNRREMAYSPNRTAGIAGAGPATPTFVMPGLQAALGNLVR
jgi:hypothetical protein